jgi:hypothetical protein
MAATDIVSGMTLFTTLTFTTKNKIPAGGSIVITFGSNAVIANDWWVDLDGATGTSGTTLCFLSTYISGSTCVASGTNTVTISLTNAQAAGTISVVTNT